MRTSIIATFAAAVLAYGSAPALADGTTTGSADGSGTVVESIEISTALGAISMGNVDAFDGSLTSNTGTFTVKANATDTVYDVWLTVAAGNLDATNDVYIAKKGADQIPLTVTLTGNGVNINPATINAQPTSALTADGDAVSGTDASTGTVYTVTLTENNALAATYASMPDGSYTVSITANIAHGD